MTGPVGAYLFVCRVLRASAYVANSGGDHARDLAESRFHSPETACCECGFRHGNRSSRFAVRLQGLAASNCPLDDETSRKSRGGKTTGHGVAFRAFPRQRVKPFKNVTLGPTVETLEM